MKSKRFSHFSLVQEGIVPGGSLSFSIGQHTTLFPDQIYAWEVFQIAANGEKIPSQLLTQFSTGNPSLENPEDYEALQAFFNLSDPCFKCIRKPDQCEDLACWEIKNCISNTHIATVSDFDILHADANLRTDSPGSSADGGYCFRPTAENKIRLSGIFGVKVPIDSLPIVESTTIKALLFRGETLVAEEVFDWKFKLNGGPSVTEVTLSAEDYLQFCDGLIGDSLIGRAEIELNAEFEYEAGEAYTFVFYLPEDQPHTHGWVQAITQEQNRTAPPVGTHSHKSPNTPPCQEDHLNTVLSYYDCLDRSGTHSAQHVVLVPLNICPPKKPG